MEDKPTTIEVALRFEVKDGYFIANIVREETGETIDVARIRGNLVATEDAMHLFAAAVASLLDQYMGRKGIQVLREGMKGDERKPHA